MDTERSVPIFSAQAVHADLDLASAVSRVLASHWYVLGQESVAFETEFAAYLGAAHCVGVANGTDALELALRALGVARGDRVVTVANAGFYSSAAAHAMGAVPVYVDVDPQTLCMSPQGLARALQYRPAAVVVTHLYGQMADVAALAALCADAGVPLIEDCAQAHGAAYAGRMAGTWGTVGCYSFYPTKNLGAVGDGGALVTHDASLAARLRMLRQYGWTSKYTVGEPGGRNSRLDELQAAVLRVKLPHLERHNAMRRNIARRYNEALADLPLRLPLPAGDSHAMHLYVVRSAQRDALRQHLRVHGVASEVHYPVPDNAQPAYPQPHGGDPLPVTHVAVSSVLTLPCFPGLSDADVAQVIGAVRSFFADGSAAC